MKNIRIILLLILTFKIIQSQTADFLIVENPSALTIFNKYQLRISNQIRDQFVHFTPFQIIEKNELSQLLDLYKYLHDDDELPDIKEIRSVWDKIQDNGDLIYFGGFIEDTLISSCALSIIPNLTRGCKPCGLVENMVTHKNCRRRGYGKTILKEVLSHAWQRNCYKVMLMTSRLNEGTFEFYESAGFSRYTIAGSCCRTLWPQH